MRKPRVLGLVGPTASGKTALSLQLSKAYSIEIVCMDSMQFYRGLDNGTAKPTKQEQALIPHHMLDVAEPTDDYSVAEYRKAAAQAIDGILARGRLPVLVGGTGLYLRALSLPLTLGGTPRDDKVRAKYTQLLEHHGNEALHKLLATTDPATAKRLHPNDTRRVIRALEVWELTGIPFSRQQMPTEQDGPYDLRLYAMDLPRDTLYARIDQRVDAMLARGLVDEVKGLLNRGVKPEAQAMQGLGYKELVPVIMGETPLEEAVDTLKRRTRNYAKRQLTWFNRDQRIHWLKRADELNTLEDA